MTSPYPKIYRGGADYDPALGAVSTDPNAFVTNGSVDAKVAAAVASAGATTVTKAAIIGTGLAPADIGAATATDVAANAAALGLKADALDLLPIANVPTALAIKKIQPFDATSGAINNIALPALSGLAFNTVYALAKTDSTTNAVTQPFASGDTTLAGDTSVTLLMPGTMYLQVVTNPNVANAKMWRVVNYVRSDSALNTYSDGRNTPKFAMLPKTRRRWLPASNVLPLGTSANGSRQGLGSADETTDLTLGDAGLRTTTTGQNSNFGFYRTPNFTVVDATNKSVRIAIKINDQTNLNSMYFNLAASQAAFVAGDYFRWTLWTTGTFTAGQTALPLGDWVVITLAWADATVYGSPSRTTIGCQQLTIGDTGSSGSPVTPGAGVKWGGTHLVTPSTSKWGVVLCFDDSYAGHWDIARPILDAAGGVGTMFPIQSFVGQSGSVTLAQLKDLTLNHGWEVGSHASNLAVHTDYATYTPAQALADLLTCRSWIASNGLGDGGSFAYPLGFFGSGIDAAITPYCSGARTINRVTGSHEVSPVQTPHRIRSISGIGGTGGYSVTNITGGDKDLDRCAAEKTILFLTFHNVTVAASTNINTISKADFQTIVNAIVAKGIPFLTMSEALAA